ncbi:MAG: hypothetical protein ACPG4T_08415 [Nannocystaceae bacterium]
MTLSASATQALRTGYADSLEPKLSRHTKGFPDPFAYNRLRG